MEKSPPAGRPPGLPEFPSCSLFLRGLFLGVLFLLLAAPPAPAELRKFTNTSGKEIIAEVVSGKGDLVQLRMDGRTIKTRIDAFSAADQEYLRKWIKDNPPKIDYHFDIDIDKKKLERNLQDVGYKKYKNDVYAYRVTITNRTRETVSGLKAKYRAFKEDRVDGQYIRSNLEIEMKEGAVEIPELKYNHSASFDTESFVLDEVRYDYTTRTTKDNLQGLLIRILDGEGNIVADVREGESSIKNRSWDQKKPGQGGSKKAVIVSPLGG